jgi:hypothetical protein
LTFWAGVLGRPLATELPAFWVNLVPTALAKAESDLRAALAALGYSVDQTANLDGGNEAVVIQAAFYLGCLGRTHLGEEYTWDAIEALDQREAWAEGGTPAVIDPETGLILAPLGLIGCGSLRNNSALTQKGTVDPMDASGGELWKEW